MTGAPASGALYACHQSELETERIGGKSEPLFFFLICERDVPLLSRMSVMSRYCPTSAFLFAGSFSRTKRVTENSSRHSPLAWLRLQTVFHYLRAFHTIHWDFILIHHSYRRARYMERRRCAVKSNSRKGK